MSLSKNIVDRTLRTKHGEHAYKVVERLTDAGHDAWWVGGCVRDMLLGQEPSDIDIATSALPNEIIALFDKVDVQGKEWGSLHVTVGKEVFHITMFREDDAASDGRRPEAVVFGSREQDALRRDITVNAVYFHPITRELYDPCGGEKDLQEKLIRFIGDPALRIKHDALRMLRVVRFRALLDGQYHPETFIALKELASHIEILSGSRRLEELDKILLGPHSARALEDLWELNILEYMLPELYACKGVPQPADYHHEGDVWEHMLLCTKGFTEEHGKDVRLAVLFHDCGKAETFSFTRSTSSGQEERIRFDHHASVSADLAQKALQRLQCPAKRREKICWLIAHHMMMGSFFDMSDERKAHWYYHPWFEELLQLFWLDIAGTDPADFALYDRIVQDRNRFLDSHPLPKKPLLSGDEVMHILKVSPGEKVGEVLKALHDAQVRGEVNSKKEAKEFLRHFPLS